MSFSNWSDLFTANSWLRYITAQITVISAACLLLHIVSSFYGGSFDCYAFATEFGILLAFVLGAAVFLFSLLEKTNKERFVLDVTNQRSRKQLMTIVNNATSVVAIVAQNG